MIERGIQELEKAGCAVVVVLGHADYYPKFGFAPASRYCVKSQWEGIPDGALAGGASPTAQPNAVFLNDKDLRQ